MFVRRSRYVEVMEENLELLGQVAMLNMQLQFLRDEYLHLEHQHKTTKKKSEKQTVQVNTQFTQEEIRKLVMLCHPDKHGGKAIATEMTQKLLALRK